MRILITKDRYGHMRALEGVSVLFEFDFRTDANAWLFWTPGREFNPCVIPGKKFPMKYFADACRAVHFLRNDSGLNESVIVEGIKYTIVK